MCRWKCFCVITAVMFTVLAARAGDAWQTNYTAFGRLLVTQFVSAPFPHPARAAGHKYHDKFFPPPNIIPIPRSPFSSRKIFARPTRLISSSIFTAG